MADYWNSINTNLSETISKIETKNVEHTERLFSPSKWSKRFENSDDVIQNHISIITRETYNNIENYMFREGIPYGSSDGEKFDIYYKYSELDKPIFVYIHGGYWQALSKQNSGYCVKPLVENGYRVIIVDYDLCPNISLMQIVEQIKRAIYYIVQYASDTNASSITLCGHSAGAHLIAKSLLSIFATSVPNLDLIKSIFLISGVYDLTKLYKTEAVNPNNILNLDKRIAKILSPKFTNFQILRDYFNHMQFHILAAENDSPAFIEQSEDFYQRLNKYGYNSFLKIFENYDHFDIVEELRDEEFEITKYILQNILK
ncbi:kynurenine formamidase [Condylostylus longicornis]|uniref:kynurenine formamidase n=1 Tax=Condylostylus longicornis TaxID=2530218 RepID=UPI00244E37E5|nr:kynurenine formamidase [Condylostylus longicornis]